MAFLDKFIDFAKPLLLFIFSDKCFDEYFLEYNFLNGECFKQTLSKVLSLGLILGSMTVKVPQIVKIYKGKSGKGLNIPSTLLDLTAITIHAGYNYVNGFPFSSWGDAFMLGIQQVTICYLIFHYANQHKQAILFMITYFSIVIALCTVTPPKVLWMLQACNVPILMSGKLLQSYENYKNGSTGQLAAATIIALTLGSIARIFTSIQETGDTMMVVTYVASTSANCVLFFQIFYYWNVTDKTASPKASKISKKIDERVSEISDVATKLSQRSLKKESKKEN